MVVDAGVVDAGVVDSGVVDSGTVDAGVVDAGVVDAGGALRFGDCDGGCTVTALAAGSYFSCAELSDGLRCWGDDLFGQLALDLDGGRSALPLKARQRPGAFRSLAAGLYHACGVVGQDVWCWGLNFHGQLGNGLFQNSVNPVRVVGLPAGVEQIVAGHYHTCVRSDGGVYCWGANGGILGLDAQDSGPSSVPVRIQGLEPVRDLSSAAQQICAVSVNGGVWCWGYSSTAFTETPRVVAGWAGGVSRVATAGFIDPHVCVVLSTGEVECIGPPETRGNLDAGASPARVGGLTGPADFIASGAAQSCALVDGGVECWGLFVSRVPVPGRAESVSIGAEHACAIVAGRAYCWGSNGAGQLGTTRIPLNGFSVDPVPVGPWEL